MGLAVDFVVHLAEGYHMAHASGRKERLKIALERMGISVFSGACTTLGASAFMLFAKIQFFFQVSCYFNLHKVFYNFHFCLSVCVSD